MTTQAIPPEAIPFEMLITSDGKSAADKVLELLVVLANCACEPDKNRQLAEDRNWLDLTHDWLASLHYESDVVSSDGRKITLDDIAKVAEQRMEARRQLAF